MGQSTCLAHAKPCTQPPVPQKMSKGKKRRSLTGFRGPVGTTRLTGLPTFHPVLTGQHRRRRRSWLSLELTRSQTRQSSCSPYEVGTETRVCQAAVRCGSRDPGRQRREGAEKCAAPAPTARDASRRSHLQMARGPASHGRLQHEQSGRPHLPLTVLLRSREPLIHLSGPRNHLHSLRACATT